VRVLQTKFYVIKPKNYLVRFYFYYQFYSNPYIFLAVPSLSPSCLHLLSKTQTPVVCTIKVLQ
jgi:hypothetical protein